MPKHNTLDYEVLAGWEKMPEGWNFVEVAGVGVDSKDRVYVFCRGEYPVIVFDKEGVFLNAWGQGIFTTPHGVFVDDKDHLYLVDSGDHTIRVFTTEGVLLNTIGKVGQSSDTGFELFNSPVLYSGEPFNRLTNVAVLKDGSMYVADGYGNARIHKFSAEGQHLFSWGEPGSGVGQFNLPHGIGVDSAGTVYVCDRENSRVQLFAPDGSYLRSWNFPNRPSDIFIDRQDNIYLAEIGFQHGNTAPIHYQFMQHPPAGHDPIARVSICDPEGNIQQQIGGKDPVLPGNFISPHGIWADSRGDIYVGEVVLSSGAVEKLAPLPVASFQKFQRSG